MVAEINQIYHRKDFSSMKFDLIDTLSNRGMTEIQKPEQKDTEAHLPSYAKGLKKDENFKKGAATVSDSTSNRIEEKIFG